MADVGKLVVDVRGMPEVIWQVRHACAQALRQEAEAEANPAVARRLLELADRFEAGQAP